jgi:hypothetical protein
MRYRSKKCLDFPTQVQDKLACRSPSTLGVLLIFQYKLSCRSPSTLGYTELTVVISSEPLYRICCQANGILQNNVLSAYHLLAMAHSLRLPSGTTPLNILGEEVGLFIE